MAWWLALLAATLEDPGSDLHLELETHLIFFLPFPKAAFINSPNYQFSIKFQYLYNCIITCLATVSNIQQPQELHASLGTSSKQIILLQIQLLVKKPQGHGLPQAGSQFIALMASGDTHDTSLES